MKLFNIKETSEKTGKSKATIYRFYKDNPELKEETKIVNKKRVIPEAHLSKISKTSMYTKVLDLDKQNRQLKRLVDLLAENPNSIQYILYKKKWSWFCTITFKVDRGKKYCYHEMAQAFEHINKTFGNEIGLKIFFALEPFVNRDGSHIHFILDVRKKSIQESVISELRKYFKGNKVDFSPYDKYQAGVYYISKLGLKEEHWDILGDLSK